MRIAWLLTTLLFGGTALATWFARPETGDHATFGRTGSIIVLLLAIAASVAGTALSRPGASGSLKTRRLLGVVMVALAIGVEFLAFGHFAEATGAPETMLGIFLTVTAISLAAITVNLFRARIP